MIKSFTTFVSSCVCGEANWTHTKKILRIEGSLHDLPPHSLALGSQKKKEQQSAFAAFF